MAQYFGAKLTGIAKLPLNESPSPRPLQPAADPPSAAPGEDKGDGPANDLPFAVVCVVQADYDPRTSPGIGGQVPVQNGLFITFVLSAWIRELGFRANIVRNADTDALAAKARLGNLNGEGRLVTAQFGANVHVADAIYTDLPLAADG
jgi:hypothetical protein